MAEIEQLQKNNDSVQRSVSEVIEKNRQNKSERDESRDFRKYLGLWFKSFEKRLKGSFNVNVINTSKLDFSNKIIDSISNIGNRVDRLIDSVGSIKFPKVEFPKVQKVEVSNFPKTKKVEKVKVVNQNKLQKVEITNWKLPKIPEFPKIEFPEIPKVKFPKLQRVAGSLSVSNFPKIQRVELINLELLTKGTQLMVDLLEELRLEVKALQESLSINISQPMPNAIKSTGNQINGITKYDANDDQPTYIGTHDAPNASDDDTSWQILKYTYSGSDVTQIQRANGAWSNRASLF